MKLLVEKIFALSVIIVALLFSSNVMAQTPGLIYLPATGAGAAVLDPNGDGYASATTAGFIANDKAESEIPYAPTSQITIKSFSSSFWKFFIVKNLSVLSQIGPTNS